MANQNIPTIHQVAGNVGIGVATPSAKLHIDNGTGTALYINTDVADTTTRDAIYLFENDSQATGRQAISWYNGNQNYYKARLWTEVGASYLATQFGIDVADDSRTVATRLIIRNGNVGIGGTTTAYKLDVTGDIRATGTIYGNVSGTAGGETLSTVTGRGASTSTNLAFNGNVVQGGGTARSTYGTTIALNRSTTFSANSDVGDGERYLSIVNDNSTTNAMSVLGFRINPNGGSANAMLDLKFVNTGATNTSKLHYSFLHGGSWADRLTLQSDGNVGIGTTSPAAKLEVNGTSGDGSPTFRVTSTAAGSTFNWAGSLMNSSLGSSRNYILLIGQAESTKNSGYIGFNHSGTSGSNSNFLTFGLFSNDNILNVTGAGKVGIGVTAPDAKLEVSGEISIRGSNYLYFGQSSNSVGSWVSRLYGSGGFQYFNANGFIFNNDGYGASEYMRITTTGNIGIGTTSPATKLEVNGNTTIGGFANIYGNLDGATLPGNGSTTAAGIIGWNRSGGNGEMNFINAKGAGSTGGFRFSKWDGTTLTNQVAIDGNGNLGIGTITPAAKLEVNGDFKNGLVYRYPHSQISPALNSTGWIKLATVPNNSRAKFLMRNGAANSEEIVEFDVYSTYYNSGVYVVINRNTYNYHLTEVIVTGADGSNRTVYVKCRTSDYAPTFTWQLESWFGTSTIHNTEETPTGGKSFPLGTTGYVYSNNVPIAHFTGSMGIGIISPAEKLDVRGNIKLETTTGATATPDYIWLGNTFSNGTTRDKLKIYLYKSGTELYGFGVGSTGDVQYHSNTTHDFYIANSSAVRINSTGVGIGTTAPDVKLHTIGGTTKLNKNATKTTISYSAADLVLGDDTSSRTGYAGNGSNLFLHANGTTSITFLDQTRNLGEITYSNKLFTIGADIGWGVATTYFAGNVGIGTSSTNAPLAFADVTGLKIQLNGTAANYYGFEKQAAVNSGDSLLKYNAGNTAAGEHGFYSGGSLKFLINKDGNVGIGASNPSAKLVVNTNFSTINGVTISTDDYVHSQLILRKAASKTAYGIMAWESQVYVGAGVYYEGGVWVHHNSNVYSQLLVRAPGTGVNWYASSNSSVSWNVAANVTLWNDSGYWRNLVQSNVTGDSYFTGGSVGIGTTSPYYKLDVNGSFRTVNGNLTIFNDYIYVSPSNQNTLNSAYNTAGTADMWINYRGYSDGFSYYRNFNVGNGQGGNIAYFNGTNGRMSINNGQTTNYTLDVAGTIGFSGFSGGSYRKLATPSYWGYSASYKAIILGSSSSTYNVADGAVTLCFGVDITGNANGSFTGDGRELVFRNLTKFVTPNSSNDNYLNPLTFNNGNVGIGTDSPYDKLEVAGGVAATGGAGGNASQASAAILSWEGSYGAVTSVDWGAEYKPFVIRAKTIDFQIGVGSVSSKAYIDGNGNFGIGTTPSSILHVVSGGNIWSFNGGGASTPYNNNSNGFFTNAGNISITAQYGTINWPETYSTANTTKPWWMLGNISGTVGQWKLNLRTGWDGSSGGLDREVIGVFTTGADTTRTIDYIRFSTGAGSEAMRINSNGNVGMGQTSPGYKLDVAGDIRVSGNLRVSTANTTGNGIVFADDGDIVDLNDAYCSMRISYGLRIYSIASGGSVQFQFATGQSGAPTYLNAGNVGIGTTAPDGKLDVRVAGSGTWDRFIVNTTSLWGDGSTQYVTIGSGGAAGIMLYNPHVVWNSGNSAAGIRLGRSGGVSGGAYYEIGTGTSDSFHIKKDGSSTRFYVKSDGNIGIGTTTPDQTLHVAGAIRYNSNSNPITEYSGTVATADNYPTCNAKARIYTIGTINANANYNAYIEVEVIGSHRGYTVDSYYEYKRWIITVGDKVSSRLVFSCGAVNKVGLWNGTDATGYKGASASPADEANGKVLKLIVNSSCGSGFTYTVKVKYADLNLTHGPFTSVDHTTTSVTIPLSQFHINGDNPYIGIETGNVGVGNSSLAYKLDIAGTLRSTGASYFATTSGNVGIGTTSPGAKLEVAGGIRLENNYNLYWGSATSDQSAGTNTPVITAAQTLGFYIVPNGTTSGTTFRIAADGNVGIGTGTASPSYKLDVGGTGRVSVAADKVFTIEKTSNATNNQTALYVVNNYANHSWGVTAEFRTSNAGSGADRPSIIFSSAHASTRWSLGYGYTDDHFRIKTNLGYYDSGWGTTRLFIKTDGNVGIGTESPSTLLEVNGSAKIVTALGVGTGPSATAGEIRATDNITAYYTSDERLKTNVTKIDNALDKVKQIDGVLYDWTDEFKKERGGEDGYFIRNRNSGIIAQQVEKVFPNVVADKQDGYKAVRYELLVPLLIEAIKEQNNHIENLKNELTELKKAINSK